MLWEENRKHFISPFSYFNKYEDAHLQNMQVPGYRSNKIPPSKTMPIEEHIRESLKKSLKKSFKERRGRLEIIADVLLVAKEGAKKTAIVYKANLNFNRAGKYLLYLEEKGHIEHTNEGYKTTERGKEFLQDYQKMKEQLIT